MNSLREVVESKSNTDWYIKNKDKIKFELNHLELHDLDDYLFSMYKKGIISSTNDSNSNVSYLIGITSVEPYEQVKTVGGSFPDIDMDFAQDRRDEVKQHLVDKYGQERVASIGTFMFPKPKGLFKDVARMYDLDFVRSNEISRLFPDRPDLEKFDDALKESPDLLELYNKDAQIKEIIDYAQKLEGTIRSVSIHPCGVCISADEPITDIVPLFESGGQSVTQFDGETLEKIGLIKYDILGLKNLSTISRTIELIKKNRGIDLDIYDIPLDDKKAYDLISSGNSLAVFQLEGSQSLRDFAAKAKPTCIQDISAIISLYRPGPIGMGALDKYLARKLGQEKCTFNVPEFDYIFKDTYGLLIYQEQLIRLSEDMCGFTDIESDDLRKAVGKKDRALLLKQKEKFVNGAVRCSGQRAEDISKLFDEMEEFARYCFNLSHSICYSFIAYQTAYLKANYTSEYMAAAISIETDPDSQSAYIEDARRNGVNVLPPDVNDSVKDFTVRQNGDILFGLNCIKGLGGKAVDKLLAIKPFSSFGSFLIKAYHAKGINKKVIESLINCGAMDVFGYKRSIMIAKFEEFMLDYSKAHAKYIKLHEVADSETKEISTFFLNKEASYFMDDNINEYPILKVLDYEKELLGIYVSDNPFSVVSKSIDDEHTNIEGLIAGQNPGYVLVNISAVKKILTKNKDNMAFVDVLDNTGLIKSITFFPKEYEKYKELLIPGQFVLMFVNPKTSTRGIDLIGASVRNLTEEMQKISKVNESKNKIREIDLIISEPIGTVRFNTLINKISEFVVSDYTGYKLTLKYEIDGIVFKLNSWNSKQIDIPMLRTFNKFQGIYLSRGK